MTAFEQILDCFCPGIGQEVQLRIIYHGYNTRMCQVNIEPAFCECLLSDNCSGYQSKDKDCLLLGFHNINKLVENEGLGRC